MKMKNLLIALSLVAASATATANAAYIPLKIESAVASTGNAALAIDGNQGTRWESEQKDNQWIYFDLGKKSDFSSLQMVWEGAYMEHYNVYVADELTAAMSSALTDEDVTNDFSAGWTQSAEVNQVLTGFPNTFDLTEMTVKSGRYIALQCLKRGTPYGCSLWEFRVMSTESVTPVLTTLSISVDVEKGSTASAYTFRVTAKDQLGMDYALTEKNWKVDGPGTATFDGDKMTVDARGAYTVSLLSEGKESNKVVVNVVAEGANLALRKSIVSSTGGSQNPEFAIDGDGGTMWMVSEPAETVDHIYDAEIVVDLQDVYDVNCIHTYWEGATSSDYTVTFSTDNVTFSDPVAAFTVTEGQGMIDRHDWLSQEQSVKARYVKLHSTKAATMYGTKLREIEVYSNSPLAPAALTKIELVCKQNVGHVDMRYAFETAYFDQYGNPYELTAEDQAKAQWVVTGEGAKMEGQELVVSQKGAYTVAYKVGDVQSEIITVNAVATGENIAVGRVISAQTEGFDRSATMAVDGNGGSDWFIKSPDNNADFEASFTIDFETVANINAIQLNWEGANAAEYEIQFSDNGQQFSTWKTFSTTPKVEGRQDWHWTETLSQARFVRLICRKAANGNYGYRLFEFEIYGEDNGDVSGVDTLEDNGASIVVSGSKAVMPEMMANVSVYAVNGSCLISENGVTEIDLSSLQGGVYVVRAEKVNGEVLTAKFVK